MEQEIRLILREDGWKSVYQSLVRESPSHSRTSASDVKNRSLNRYGDVYPFDHSRVILRHLSSTDYINASFVKNERANRNYILAQGPLEKTVSHFWLMVFQERVPSIIMLNRVMEKGRRKCELYWPPNPGDELLFEDDVFLSITHLEEDVKTDYIFRKFRIRHLQTNEIRTVLHFHYLTWPDYGVPFCPDTFLQFLFAVRATGSLDESDAPVVVHCSAGIGRSGTFVLVDSALIIIEKEGISSLILRDLCLDLRQYRMGLIQTWEQLKFSYLAIVEGAKRSKFVSRDFLSDCKCSLFNEGNESSNSEEESPPPLPPPRSDSLTSKNEIHQKNDDTEFAEEKEKKDLISNGVSKTVESSSMFSNRKMEERKKEVIDLRRRIKREETKDKLMEMRRKQIESEKNRHTNTLLKGYIGPFCLGLTMVVTGMGFYYYYGQSRT